MPILQHLNGRTIADTAIDPTCLCWYHFVLSIKWAWLSMNTLDLSERFKMEHKTILRMVRDMVGKSLFSQSEIELSSYITSQNKKHACFNLSDSVISYLVTSRRAFRENNDRVAECARILGEIGVTHRVVIGNATRQEVMFGSMLESFFSTDVEIISQYPVAGYRIDFYMPSLNIAIEYDERHHNTKTNKHKDRKRIEDINNHFANLGDLMEPIWIRVNEGFEVQGIRKIVGAALHHGLDNDLNYLGYESLGFE